VSREGSPTDLVEVELRRLALPLRRAHRAGHGTEERRDVVVVRATLADGSEGWGECSTLSHPTYTEEYTAGAWALLRDVMVPAALAGADDVVVGHPMARAALVGARLDAGLRRRDRRLVEHLGERHGLPVDSVAVAAVVGRPASTDASHAAALDRVVAEVAEAVASGAVLVKLKVTPDPADLAAVAAVRATWPDLALAVDGNGTLDVRSLAILDGHGLAYIEQPAPADALLESAAFAARLAAPIALDESVTSLATFDTAAALGAGAVLNVKPARLGGAVAAADLARHASEHGWRVFVGGMLETGVGRATALAVAALPVMTLPTDLGPSDRYFDADVTEAIGVDADGRVVVPVGPGIGVVPDGAALDSATVERVVLRR
jgi:O-succinylbenzoate synthase